jgi:hypothetical protein
MLMINERLKRDIKTAATFIAGSFTSLCSSVHAVEEFGHYCVGKLFNLPLKIAITKKNFFGIDLPLPGVGVERLDWLNYTLPDSLKYVAPAGSVALACVGIGLSYFTSRKIDRNKHPNLRTFLLGYSVPFSSGPLLGATTSVAENGFGVVHLYSPNLSDFSLLSYSTGLPLELFLITNTAATSGILYLSYRWNKRKPGEISAEVYKKHHPDESISVEDVRRDLLQKVKDGLKGIGYTPTRFTCIKSKVLGRDPYEDTAKCVLEEVDTYLEFGWDRNKLCERLGKRLKLPTDLVERLYEENFSTI